MKLKDGFMLREIAGQWVVVPIAARVVEFNGIITLNETGAFIWEAMTQGKDKADILTAMLQEYEIDSTSAEKDVDEFVAKLQEKDLLEVAD